MEPFSPDRVGSLGARDNSGGVSKPVTQLGTPFQRAPKRKHFSPTVDLVECKEASDARTEVEETNLTESGVPREHVQAKRRLMQADNSGDCVEELTASALQNSLVGSLARVIFSWSHRV